MVVSVFLLLMLTLLLLTTKSFKTAFLRTVTRMGGTSTSPTINLDQSKCLRNLKCILAIGSPRDDFPSGSTTLTKLQKQQRISALSLIITCQGLSSRHISRLRLQIMILKLITT